MKPSYYFRKPGWAQLPTLAVLAAVGMATELFAVPAVGEGLADQLQGPAISFDGAAPRDMQVVPPPIQVAYSGVLEHAERSIEAAGEAFMNGAERVTETAAEGLERSAEVLGETLEKSGEALGNLAEGFLSFIERLFGN